MISLLLHELLALALLWSCFCRLTITDSDTHTAVRLAFWLLAVASIALLAAPLLGWLHLAWPTTLLLAAIATTQIVTARYWRNGVPAQFKRRKSPLME